MSGRRSIALGAGVAAAILLGLAALVGGEDTRRWTHAAPVLMGLTIPLWLVMVATERQRRRAIFTPLWAGLAAAAALVIIGPSVPGALTGGEVRGWSAYHYYVGSKYFADTGYFDLYEATIAADDRFDGPGWDDADKVRDMRTYRLEPRGESSWAGSMSADRLDALGADSRFFYGAESPKRRRKLVQDLGFNPAPPWLLLGRPMANAVDVDSPAFGLVTASDLVMHVVLFAALCWGFGLRVACIALLWLLCAPFNQRRLVGGFFNYDWLAVTAVALAAWKKERAGLAGGVLAWAAMSRVFPGLMALPLLWRAAAGRIRGERDRRRERFALVFCATCAVLAVAACGTGRGVGVWAEWADKISIHSAHHAETGSKRVGLGRLVLHHPAEGWFWRVPRPLGDADRATSAVRKRVGIGLGLILLLWGLRRREDGEAMLLMLFAVWLLSVSSRYYANIWMLLLVLPTVGPRGWTGRWTGACLMALLGLLFVPSTLTMRYLLVNYLALAMFAGWCLLRARAGSRSDAPRPPSRP